MAGGSQPTPAAAPGRGSAEIPSSLFTQIFALVLATVAIAQIINLALLAALPQDPPRIIPIVRLAEAIRSGNEEALLFRRLPAQPFDGTQSGPGATRMEAELARLLGRSPADVSIDVTAVQGRKFVEYYPQGSDRPQAALQGPFRIAIREPAGWLLVEPADRQLLATRERQFLLLFLLSALAMLPIAWMFARRLAEPFERFADAAEALGRDPRAEPPQVRGPAEVERASDAFRQMQKRLQAYVTDRTQMLGAIAHDLRTPLTRLAFRLEALDGVVGRTACAGLQSDVAEMEAMVQSTLGLARADSQPVERQLLELGSLVEKAAEDLAVTGRAVTAEALDQMVIYGDPVGLRRLMTNLLDNGESYGKRAHARAWRDGLLAIIDVEDEGPGLPPGEEERVFEPFYRLERSRSRETGGTGLGLSVARSIARLHGGDVVLTNRAGKGLRARVTLPIAD